MSVKIVSGPEWLPIKVQEGLGEQRKKEGFVKEIKDNFNDGEVMISTLNLPIFNQGHKIYKYGNYSVFVRNSVDEKFRTHFAPYLNGDVLEYDNLMNVCIMVKNAGESFRDMLTKNLPFIDQYTILDTGSTDNTINIAREVLKDKRGKIYEEPFINFRDSRNRLLDLAGTECFFNVMLDDTYVLNGKVREFLEYVRGDDDIQCYSITIEDVDTMYMSARITKSTSGLRYENLIHEIIKTDVSVSIPREWGHIVDENNPYMRERTIQRKQQDLDILMQMNREDPSDPRNYYYIADSYICLKDWENAVKWFKKRVEFGGYQSEVQDALYYIATIQDHYLNFPWPECLEGYLRCYDYDPTRAESLYLVGSHYRKAGMNNVAYIFLKRAFEIGMPVIQMSVRKHIYKFHIPSELASICYEVGDYKLGEEASRKALEWKDDEITNNWLHIFYHLNKREFYGERTYIRNSSNPVVCFVSPGGWDNWDGSTLRTKGLGGSENFTIRYAEYLSQLNCDVNVFCKCDVVTDYNGVKYLPLDFFTEYITKNVVDYCIINRFPEFIPVSALNGIKTYFVMHDLSTPETIICMHKNLKGIFCISEWHKRQFLSQFPACESITHVVSYGIETDDYAQLESSKNLGKKYNFIYPSFPNRGLLELLKMWPHIVEKYPSAHLDIFCDTKNEWCQKYWKTDMDEVEILLEQNKGSVVNHGWVNGETLRRFWVDANVWLYPCTFQETCCLTAWEAAASKTLVASNNLAALETSVGDRGVIVHGNPKSEEWRSEMLKRLFYVLDNNLEESYTSKNYDWVKTKNFGTVVPEFIEKHLNK